MVALQRGVSVPRMGLDLSAFTSNLRASLLNTRVRHWGTCVMSMMSQRCSVLREPAAVACASFPPPASSDGFSFLRQHQSAVS